MEEKPDYKAVCIFCARTDQEVRFNREHIIPKSIGGTLYLDNCVCADCNSYLGSKIDSETIKLPDVLKAFDKLNIAHDRDNIINRHYDITGHASDITGKATNIKMRFGKAKDEGFIFPEQRLSDGSLITPERNYFEALKRDVKRDQRIRDAGLTDKEIQEKLEKLRRLYEQAKPGEKVEFPELGVTLLKRSDELSVEITPRKEANINSLIAKIAYEMMFFYGGTIFLRENLNLIEKLHVSISKQEIQKGIQVMRVKPHITSFQPVHLIRLEFYDSLTIMRAAFFGSIEYILTSNPLSSSVIDFLKGKLRKEDLYALGYQQVLDKPSKSFWAFSKGGIVEFIGDK